MGLDVERLLACAVRIFRIRRRRNPHDLCAAARPREARAGRNPPCRGCCQKAGHCSLFCPTSPGVYTLDAIAVAKALKKVFPQEDISLIGAEVCYVHRIKARGKDFLRPVRTAAALLMLALWRAAAHERAAAVRTALMLLPIGVGLLISVIAPGNSVRMAADGAHESGLGYLLASIGWTLRDAVKYILRFMLKTPLLALLLLALPAASRRMNERGETGEGLPRIGFTLLGGYLMLCTNGSWTLGVLLGGIGCELGHMFPVFFQKLLAVGWVCPDHGVCAR